MKNIQMFKIEGNALEIEFFSGKKIRIPLEFKERQELLENIIIDNFKDIENLSLFLLDLIDEYEKK